MTQGSKIFDELGKLMNNAAGVADGVRREVDTMVKAGIHRIVVTEAGCPVGIITSMDLVKEYGTSLQS